MDNESFLDFMERSNAIFNLSKIDHNSPPHESDSDETDGQDDGQDENQFYNSDSSSSDGDERDQAHTSEAIERHVPNAPRFTTEDITYNNDTNNQGNFPSASSVDPLSDNLF